jgi:adenylate kinase family enzyme
MARRIVILGCAGSGKTTLARELGRRMDAPAELDAVWRTLSPKDDVLAFRRLMKAAHDGEAWISDGNFAAVTFDIRLPRANLIVWLDRSRLVCARNAVTRVFRPGEAHRMGRLGEVLAFIRNFDRINRPKIEAERLAHGPDVPVSRLTNDREIATFLEDSA